MIGKRIALEVIPNQALFSLKAAAQYLGIGLDALREDCASGKIRCYSYHGRRTFKLEDLELLRASLEEWQNGERPTPASSERTMDAE
jgi:hypothetical protein